MGLFDKIFPKKPAPYSDATLNHLYEMLFCDNLGLYQKPEPPTEPLWQTLLAEPAAPAALQAVAADATQEGRARLLAYRRLAALGQPTGPPTLLGVVVEVALPGGLDVLASFADGGARYFNQAGKLLVWEASTTESEQLREQLFTAACQTVAHIGPWDKPRLPPPTGNLLRITFLQSDGLYFGQGPFDVMQHDALAAHIIAAATQLMMFLVEQGLAREAGPVT